MKTLYFDCFAGISGDMIVGALIDLGVPFDELDTGVENIELKQKKVSKKGISAVKFDVYDKSTHKHADHSSHKVKDIEKIISSATIPSSAKQTALKIFNAIAEAENKVHGNVDEHDNIHLHEVGALDSIADIICMSLCVDYIKADKIVCSPVNTGGGTVKCAHGVLPVPAPATLELLKNIPVYSDDVKLELTTPTGAAFVKVMADEYGNMPEGKIIKTGYGAGTRDLDDRSNVLRVLLIESTGDKNVSEQALTTVCQIETQIDDMTSETLAPVFDILMKQGALDVYVSQILMKKQRPAFMLSVLAKPEDKMKIEKVILRETTTFGLRWRLVNRTVLDRKIETFESSLGPVKVKTGVYEDIVKKIPEFEDCMAISQKSNIPVWKVYNQIISELV